MKEAQIQGDVIIKKTDSIPSEAELQAPTQGWNVLAYGEITGHAHCLQAEKTQVFKAGEKTYLRCFEDVELKHQKLDGSTALDAHKPNVIEKGDYTIDIQPEYDHFNEEVRNVSD